MSDPTFRSDAPITTPTEDICMAHRGVLCMLLAELVKKKVINRQVIERRLQAMIDGGPAARMTPGVLDEIDLVRHMMRVLLDADASTH